MDDLRAGLPTGRFLGWRRSTALASSAKGNEDGGMRILSLILIACLAGSTVCLMMLTVRELPRL